MKTLYPFQSKLKQDVYTAWETGRSRVMCQLPTGGGKTVVLSEILRECPGASVAIAHRREILGQISAALTDNGIEHSVLAPDKTVRSYMDMQREKLGRCAIRPSAKVTAASIDTLNARRNTLKSWATTVRLWAVDEAHHLLPDNKWGRGVALFPNARGLGLSATPGRPDGKSLHSDTGGVFDELCAGPQPRQLIDAGYLSEYRIFAPPPSIDVSGVKIGTNGEFNTLQLARASECSYIVGDAVQHYLKLTPGMTGVTFMPSVTDAENVAAAFRFFGVPARMVNAKTPEKERVRAIRDLENGTLKQLVNVDLFGEGFDLPAIQVVIFGRPTASYNVYAQQFGRTIRAAPGKTHGVIIDAVDNVRRHGGPPDRPRDWQSEIRGYRSAPRGSDEPPLRTCVHCFKIWEGYARTCPHCGHKPVPERRNAPELVDGDLAELSADAIAALYGAIESVDSNGAEMAGRLEMAGKSPAAINGYLKRHRERRETQRELREAMMVWGGNARAAGLSDSERHIKFYLDFGTDVLTAQTLGRPEAENLRERIIESMAKL